MKSSFKKYQTAIVAAAFILIFLLLVVIATSGEAPYSSIAFSFFGFSVAWYAVFILTGIIFGAILLFLEMKKVEWDTEILWDGLLIFVPLSIVGARLWYVLFNLDKYTNNLSDIFDVTQGGLAIHGAVIFVFLGLFFFTKYKKVNYWLLLDMAAPSFLIGQTLGRWGNFMNRELYGPVLENPDFLPSFIKDQMFIGGKYHHPTFLYESLWNLLGLILVFILRRKKVFKIGDIVSLYLIWYGVGRIPIEILRLQSGVNEPLMAFGIPVSILTSLGFIFAGIAIIVIRRLMNKNIGYYLDTNNKSVLFDLDGTVLDTAELIYKTTKQTFKKYLPNINFTEEELKAFVGPVLEESFSWYEPDMKKVHEMIKTYREFNRINHEEGVKPFPNAKEVFQELKQRGYLIGIVSSKKNEFIRIGLEQNDLLKYVDVIVGADDVTKPKPDKEPILKALSLLRCSPENSAMVGDHDGDILAAKNANVVSIGVSYSIHYDKLLQAKPDYVIDDLSKLLSIF